MILQRFTDFILRNRFQAMGTVFAITFIPLVGTINILIVALVTLRKGIQEGALVLAAATLAILLIYKSTPVDQASDVAGTFNVIIIILATNVLTWLFAAVLRKFSSWSLVLQFAGLLGIVTVIILHAMYPNLQDWWQAWLTAYFNSVQHTVQLQDNGMLGNMVTNMKPYATGAAVSILYFYALLQLVVARWWQDKIFNPGGLRQELLSIRLSYAAGAVFLIALVGAMLKNDVAMDVMPILCEIFVCAGFSVMHCLVARTKHSELWLGLAYAILIATLMPTGGFLVAPIALLDIGLDFRNRWRVKPDLN